MKGINVARQQQQRVSTSRPHHTHLAPTSDAMASQEDTLFQKLQHFSGDLCVQNLVEYCEHKQYDQSEELSAAQTNQLDVGIMGAMVDEVGQPLH